MLATMPSNHPNRSKKNRNAFSNPTPTEVMAGREKAGLTQTEAAKLIRGTLRSWQSYEGGQRTMHPGLWELFLIKTGQSVER